MGKSWRKTWCTLRHLRPRRWFIFWDATQAWSQTYTRSTYKQCWSPGVAKLRSQSSYGWTQKRLFAPKLHETRLSLSSLSKSNGRALHWLTETHPDRLMACEILRKMHQLSRVVCTSELNWELLFSSKSVTEFELRYEMGCRLQFKCESKEVEFTFILKKFVWLFWTKCHSQVPKVKLDFSIWKQIFFNDNNHLKTDLLSAPRLFIDGIYWSHLLTFLK